MNAHSVAYYQSTVEENQGPDSYYSEDGTKPAEVWIKASHATNSTFVSTHLGVENGETVEDRKSTRLNSSHVASSYAVFCLKKKNEYCTVIDGEGAAELGYAL